jgi:hypothetical protein
LFILSARTFDTFEVMTKRSLVARRRLVVPIALAAFALIAAGCGGGDTEATSTSEAAGSSVAAVGTDAPLDDGTNTEPTFDFPTGEPVLVPVGYQHPRDHVDNTGAFLPTNGKPTLVFVDAIW